VRVGKFTSKIWRHASPRGSHGGYILTKVLKVINYGKIAIEKGFAIETNKKPSSTTQW
jgi:DNA-binding IscR family transcriptional regulator